MILPSSLSDFQDVTYRLPTPPAAAPSVQTPDCNTGSACTVPSESRTLLDWFSFTAPAATPIGDLVPNGDRLNWVTLDHGMHGYKSQVQCGDIRILSEGSQEMGVHVQISGQGCRQIENAGTTWEDESFNWPDYVRWVLANDWKVTRIDPCVDLVGEDLLLADLQPALAAGHATSRWKHNSDAGKRKFTGEAVGNGIQYGERGSRLYGRHYDKALEQSRRPGADKITIGWERIELECKRDAAMLVAHMFADGLDAGQIVAGVLADYIQYRTPTGSDSNRRRWEMLPAWARFLDNCARLILATAPPDRSVDSIIRWVDRVVSKNLAIIVAAKGGDLDYLTQFVTAGRRRMKPTDWALLSTA